MQAASSPSKCTCGFRIVVFIAFKFFPTTEIFISKLDTHEYGHGYQYQYECELYSIHIYFVFCSTYAQKLLKNSCGFFFPSIQAAIFDIDTDTLYTHTHTHEPTRTLNVPLCLQSQYLLLLIHKIVWPFYIDKFYRQLQLLPHVGGNYRCLDIIKLELESLYSGNIRTFTIINSID